jgi:hypothetical protein
MPFAHMLLVIILAPVGPCGAAARHRAETPQGEGVEPTASVATTQKLFDFRSGFWINLHHFLYLQAVLATPEARKGHAETSAQAAAPAPAMSAKQKEVWDRAVHFYLRFGKRDPLRDDELIVVNYELSDAGNSVSIKNRRLSPELAATLEEAAPVYRALWWADHDRLNRTWIASAAKLVAEYGPSMSRRIAAVFQTSWPPAPTPVEVVLYANWAGAYTVTNSTLITISSADPAGQGPAALETLFHEASHGLIDNLERKLSSDIRAAGKTPGFEIVHVIIFYTAGVVTIDALGENRRRLCALRRQERSLRPGTKLESLPRSLREGLEALSRGQRHLRCRPRPDHKRSVVVGRRHRQLFSFVPVALILKTHALRTLREP